MDRRRRHRLPVGRRRPRLARKLFLSSLAEGFAQRERWGKSRELAGERILVEYVSANPTGPMHVGHARGAVTGDIIARLLKAAGAEVHREYYVNDAGVQVRHLAHSVYVRAQEMVVDTLPYVGFVPDQLAPDDYQGEYIIDVARKLLEPLTRQSREGLITSPFIEILSWLQDAVVDLVMKEMIEPDLALFNIKFDKFFRESELHESGRVREAINTLRGKGLVEKRVLPPPKGQERADDEIPPTSEPLLVMRTTEFGDDVDRPLVKPNNQYTYFAGDVAYHWDKLQRGYTRLINVWGADHAGYVQRVRAAIAALGYDPKVFEVVLVQMVNLVRDGVPVRMGKRSGNFVTLREVIEEAGQDATRVFFTERTSTSQFDFDLALAKKQEDINPVFYLQYGHARAASILRKASERGIELPQVTAENLQGLALPEEMDLVQRLLAYPEVVTGAAKTLEPHRIIAYLKETIGAFHSYLTRYKSTEKVLSDDPVKTRARLALVLALKLTLGNALDLIGVSAPEQMTRTDE